MKTKNFAHYIYTFVSEYLMLERGYSQNTIQSYTQTFSLLITYAKDEKNIKLDRITIEVINKEFILGFLNWLAVERNSGDTTRNNRLAAIHSFFRYLSNNNFLYLEQCQSILSIRFKKTQKKIIEYLSPEALKLVLSLPNLKTKKGRRDLAMLSLLYDLGARVQELIDLTPSVINLKVPMTAIVKGKGRKTRVIPLLKEQILHLKIYMQENSLFDENYFLRPLFFNSRGEKLTRAGVNYVFKFYLNKARKIDSSLIPEKASCHTLRHTKAMHLRKAGINLIYIRDILGHASVVTTELYARAESAEKRKAIELAYQNLAPPSETKARWEGNSKLLDWLKSF